MNDLHWLVIGLFIVLFLERLIYSAKLKEPAGSILDAAPARIAMAMFIAISFVAFGESFVHVDRNYFLVFIGAAVSCCGIILRRISIRTLGSYWSCYTRDIKGQQLVKAGIFRYVRHPYYLAVAFELFGVILICRSRAALALFLLIQVPLLLYRIRLEERLHAVKFSRNDQS